ncbi:MAG: peptide-methionine (S)-S-oxide reductase, partial [Silanimonas sp.]
MNTASTTRLALTTLLAGALAACGQAPVTPALASAMAPKPDVPREHLDAVVLGMGCFWGAERRMGALPGVIDVESGYAN